MSRIRADKIVNRLGTGGPKFPEGIAEGFSVSGIVTATSFSGDLTGNVTGNADTATSATTATTATIATTAQGLTGIPNIVVGSVTGTTASFSGNVSVGGTLTYEDVTNIDSIGIVTARTGIQIGAGQSISAISGTIYYYGDGSNLEGVNTSGGGEFNELDAALFN